MTLRQVLKYPDSRLSVPAAQVEHVGDLGSLVTDLRDTLYAEEGLGLAAPQIGVGLRVLVIDLDPYPGTHDLHVFINPVIRERIGMAIEPATEGCLSFPDVRVTIARSARVLVQAQQLDGASFTTEATGLLAVALQHEIDHLDGVLITDRVSRQVRRDIQRRLGKPVLSRNL